MSEGPSVRYRLVHQDARCGARVGVLETPRGEIDLPTFMPVGTLGTVKGLTVEQVLSTGAQIILGNTYHLALRPGAEIVQELGGLHRFMGWERPILTDSGGFQIFSLAKLTKITEEKAVFRSHIDGSLLEMSPERSIQIQECLGSDIAMVLDHVIGLPAPREDVQEASERSIRWAERCRNASTRTDQSQFAIVQGGLDAGLRRECARALCSLDFPGYAIGGLSVGEEPEEMYRILDVTVPELPADRPRYLMGVGRPEDLLNAVGRGVDMFDCVMPTRNGRNASAFTDEGAIKLKNKQFEVDPTPLAKGWSSPVGELSRAYLRHLFMANEMLGPILLSLHNLAYYQKLMQEMREAILADSFLDLYQARFRGWGAVESPSGGWV